jgi:excinuclease ABC subunit B
VIVDESHMGVPQLWGMPRADASRKSVLIDHGFRLPSSENHRPINFNELEIMLWWKQKWEVEVHPEVFDHHKKDCRTLFVSATPAKYELENSHRIVQQVIRPTWLLDPLTYVYPKTTNYEHLMASIPTLLKKKPELNEFLDGYDQDTHLYL